MSINELATPKPLAEKPLAEMPLFAIVVRGVQRSISESHDTRDLAAASSLCSAMVVAICKSLADQGAVLVSPALPDRSDQPRSAPNRIIGCHDNPQLVCGIARTAALAVWNQAAGSIVGAAAAAPEVIWAWEKPSAKTGTLDALMMRLDGRKRLANFAPAPKTWSGTKRSEFEICPLNTCEAVVEPPKWASKIGDRFGPSLWTKRNHWRNSGSPRSTGTPMSPRSSPNPAGVGAPTTDESEGGGVNASDVWTATRFPSTWSISTRSWVERVLTAAVGGGGVADEICDASANLVTAAIELEKAFSAKGRVFATDSVWRGGTAFTMTATVSPKATNSRLEEFSRIEGFWFAAETIDHQTATEQLVGPSATATDEQLAIQQTAVRNFSVCRSTLLALVSRTLNIVPARYYALVALDGDSVGRKVSALPLEGIQNFSKELSDLAVCHRDLEVDLQCRIVYAGGDDVFALVSGADALTLASRVRRTFDSALASGGSFIDQLSASAAVLFVHASSSLQGAVRDAQQMVKSAKEVDAAKDRVVIAARRRGGLRAATSFSWSDPENVERFQRVVASFSESKLSPSVIGDIERQVGGFEHSSQHRDALVGYLVKRHSADAGQSVEMVADLLALRESTVSIGGPLPKGGPLVDLLVVARFMAAEAEL